MKNPKTVTYSLIALLFVILAFAINGWLIIIAAVFSWLGWRELMKK